MHESFMRVGQRASAGFIPRFAGAGDDYELVFASPPDASPAIECLPRELTPPITVIERKAGVRLVNAAGKRVPITASGWQHFRC